mmetsp:Transcript_2512/g.4320  ORF Transcript_2512/g.4320 Transcript_2512/m.4320 type:complete len:259 (-) Transcript_2512:1494-2270(-)
MTATGIYPQSSLTHRFHLDISPSRIHRNGTEPLRHCNPHLIVTQRSAHEPTHLSIVARNRYRDLLTCNTTCNCRSGRLDMLHPGKSKTFRYGHRHIFKLMFADSTPHVNGKTCHAHSDAYVHSDVDSEHMRYRGQPSSNKLEPRWIHPSHLTMMLFSSPSNIFYFTSSSAKRLYIKLLMSPQARPSLTRSIPVRIWVILNRCRSFTCPACSYHDVIDGITTQPFRPFFTPRHGSSNSLLYFSFDPRLVVERVQSPRCP